MRNLLNFLIKFHSWFVFIFYVLLSCILLVSGSSYRQSIYLTSANAVSSTLAGAAGEVTGYFGLRSKNQSLEERTAELESEVHNLREQVNFYRSIVLDTLGRSDVAPDNRYHYILAPVLNNTSHRPRNYITIAKGYREGVKPGMGVVDHNGLVGVVNVSGPHTARIVSVINDAVHFSVRLKNTPYVGTLSWKGNDRKVAYMEEVPRHMKFTPGDTIETSGFSTSFPPGIPVGTVIGLVRGDDDNYYTLKVRLATDFSNISAVRVINDRLSAEIDTLKNYDLK